MPFYCIRFYACPFRFSLFCCILVYRTTISHIASYCVLLHRTLPQHCIVSYYIILRYKTLGHIMPYPISGNMNMILYSVLSCSFYPIEWWHMVVYCLIMWYGRPSRDESCTCYEMLYDFVVHYITWHHQRLHIISSYSHPSPLFGLLFHLVCFTCLSCYITWQDLIQPYLWLEHIAPCTTVLHLPYHIITHLSHFCNWGYAVRIG